MSTVIKEVTVIGATGNLARPTIRQWIQQGLQVKVIVRDVDKARSVLPDAVQWVPGDLRDVESLRRGLEGSRHVYPNTPIRRFPLWLGRLMGLFNAELRFASHMMAFFEQFQESLVACETGSVLGEPITSLEDVFRKERDALGTTDAGETPRTDRSGPTRPRASRKE